MSNLESRFTPARDWCPNPEYWHSPDSEATEEEVSEFIGSIVRLMQPEYVVETGTYHGHTANEIGAALYQNGHGRLDTIEANTEAYETARNSIIPYYPINLIHANTMDFVPAQNIDFLFLDSWQEGRVLEFNRFLRLGFIQTGMIFAVHDTAPHHQVRRTLIDFATEYSMIDFHTPRGVILGQVL